MSILENKLNCRLCEHRGVSIFSDKDNESLSKLILKYLNLKLEPADPYSTNLCCSCTENLQRFHNFYQRVQKSQLNLQPMQISTANNSRLQSFDLKNKPALEKTWNCRLCFNKCEFAKSVFLENDEKSWSQLIYKYLLLKFKTDHINSTRMCENCKKSLQNFHNFYQCVQSCQLSLRKTTSTIVSTEQSLISIAETDEKFLKKDEYEKYKVINKHETTVVKRAYKSQTMDEDFSDVSIIKEEFLSAEEESIEFLEDLKATDKLTQETLFQCNEPVKRSACKTTGFESREVYDKNANEAECEKPIEASSATSDIMKRTCSVCSRVLATAKSLKAHMLRLHSGNQEASERTCHICSKEYDTVERMKKHVRFQHNQKNEDIANRICSVCSKVFSTVRGLYHHMRDQHIEKQDAVEDRTCHICFKVFDKIEKKKNHIRDKHSEKNEEITNRTCSICSKVYSTIVSLKQHMRIQHNDKQDAIEQRTCAICFKVYDTIEKMKKHMRIQHILKTEDITSRTCSICSKVYSTVLCLKQHMRDQHVEKEEAVTDRTCGVCSKVYATIEKLKAHMYRNHSHKNEDITNRTCAVCFKVYSTVWGLYNHMRDQHKGKQNAVEQRTCHICSKIYDTIEKMKSHIRLRHNPKDEDISNRTCSICCKVSINAVSLKKHMRIKHSGKQEAVDHRTCTMCHKAYDTVEKLKSHVCLSHKQSFDKVAQLDSYMPKEDVKAFADTGFSENFSERYYNISPSKPNIINQAAKQNAKVVEELSVNGIEETKWLQVKREEPIEINDYLD